MFKKENVRSTKSYMLTMTFPIFIKQITSYTVKREMLVAIIFDGFENITICQRFNLAILLEEVGVLDIFFILVTTNFCNYF